MAVASRGFEGGTHWPEVEVLAPGGDVAVDDLEDASDGKDHGPAVEGDVVGALVHDDALGGHLVVNLEAPGWHIGEGLHKSSDGRLPLDGLERDAVVDAVVGEGVHDEIGVAPFPCGQE